ncbi:uncharacterized protein [Pseudochaenichthys georgianus]|uniref:uncharacterized protein n=1 Tax=Pseudochaenichthys georgianus TaxID=52239 RepID=UPI00146CF305|nr:uncharacterized protein LOC117459432 [Pseudochaenichthys georgianus]
MRADSPGHSAKFGSYTLMNLGSNIILDFQLVQSNEVGGSYHMEKEGLKRCLDHLESKDLAVEYIVTDRHPQIQKYLRERNIKLFYDVWHFEKGLSKKLLKLTQNKDCDTKLKRWLRSIKNHVYWSATSTTSGPEKVARWTSLVNHLQNVHVHDDPLFPKCTHPVGAASDANKPYLKGVYVDELTRLVFHKVFLDPTPFVDELKQIHVPEDLSTQFERAPQGGNDCQSWVVNHGFWNLQHACYNL